MQAEVSPIRFSELQFGVCSAVGSKLLLWGGGGGGSGLQNIGQIEKKFRHGISKFRVDGG